MSALDGRLAALEQRCVRLSRALATLSVLVMLLLSLLTITDVTLRYVANYPIPGFYETMQLLMIVIIGGCLPSGIAQRNNLNIDFFGKAIGIRAGAILAAVGGVLLLAFMAIVAWRFAVFAGVLQRRGEISPIAHIPVPPFYWCVAVFLALCVPPQIVIVARQVLAAGAALRNELPLVATADEPVNPARERTARVLFTVLFAVAGTALMYLLMADAHGRGWQAGLAIFGFAALWLPVLFLIPLGPTMGFAGLVGAAFLVGWQPALDTLAIQSAAFLGSLDLAVLPLFLMMGSFASAAGLSSDLYRLAHACFGNVKGGLAMATIGACAGFGSLTGSSLATCATIGRVALPEMRKHGYAPHIATGTVAAGGTLGQLIPPSSMLVLYGVLTETSIGRLFIAAIVPGLIATVLYMGSVAWMVRATPGAAPSLAHASSGELWAALKRSWGVFAMFGIVIGGIYGGIFTVTEAAAVGAGIAFLFALGRGSLKGGVIWRVFGDVAANTALIYLLLFGAVIFAFFTGVTQVPNALIRGIETLRLEPFVVIVLIALAYILLGCVMDSITMILVTVPVVMPLIAAMGYDLVWWGIVTLVVVEIGVLTPPMGINCFVIKGMVPDVPLRAIFRGVIPFVGSSVVKLIFLMIFPALALWLPAQMMR